MINDQFKTNTDSLRMALNTPKNTFFVKNPKSYSMKKNYDKKNLGWDGLHRSFDNKIILHKCCI